MLERIAMKLRDGLTSLWSLVRLHVLHDRYTWMHFGMWGGISLVAGLLGAPFLSIVVVGLLVGILWEIVERRWEVRYAAEPESFFDRWVWDPSVDALGSIVGWALARLVLLVL